MYRLLLVSSVLILASGTVFAQKVDPLHPSNDPSVGNNRKQDKESTARIIQGMVTDASGKPARGAIVHMKDTKTSKVVEFATREDGLFAFRDLSMDVTYELEATRGDAKAALKKVSPYDTRKQVTLTFKLEEPAAGDKAEQKKDDGGKPTQP